ncbi:hypothetical protein GCM10017687_24560 [Streptomyces echinatus]|uniref:hypothetical protein n=1 Tax=Streptomyces echinatus TaxID=67293 RepID=UPI0031EF99D3
MPCAAGSTDATRVATEDACKGMEDETQMKLRADVAKEQYEEGQSAGPVGARRDVTGRRGVCCTSQDAV